MIKNGSSQFIKGKHHYTVKAGVSGKWSVLLCISTISQFPHLWIQLNCLKATEPLRGSSLIILQVIYKYNLKTEVEPSAVSNFTEMERYE